MGLKLINSNVLIGSVTFCILSFNICRAAAETLDILALNPQSTDAEVSRVQAIMPADANANALVINAQAHELSEPSNIEIPFVEGEAEIDGDINDEIWSKASSSSLNYVTRTFDNTVPPVTTKVSYFENGKTLFVLFQAFDDEPQNIRAFWRDRDSLSGQDLVGIKLDTYGDGRLAYQFFVNAFGVQTDAIENEMTGNESASWNGIWRSSGKITDTGYQVELAIPLRILNFKEADEVKNWGIEFVRFYSRKLEYRISHVPYDRGNSCYLCQLGSASGFETAKQGQNLAVVPTAVVAAGRTRTPEESMDWENFDNQEIGLDVKWAITPEISLLGTFNPDFSQVESDVAQLSVNNTFALFFDERRPFFVENEDYFTSDQTLIYTRNINAPDYGAKVTGRVDKHSLGVFVANDETTSFIVPGNLGSSIASIEEESLNLGLRYRFDYSEELSIGTVVTLRETDSYHNYVTGIDAKYRLSDIDTVQVQAVRTETEYPFDLYQSFCDDNCSSSDELSESALRTNSPDAIEGLSYRINYRRNAEKYFWRAGHYYTDGDFRADLGFQSSVDRVTSVIGGGYIWRNQDSWWNRIRVNGDWDITHNTDGELIERESEIYASIRGDYQSFFEIGLLQRDRVGLRQDATNLRIDDNTQLFDEKRISSYFTTRPNQYFSVDAFVAKGEFIDFSNNRLGDQFEFEPGVSINVGAHARLNIEHAYVDFDAAGEDLFTANLTDVRLTYQFDQRQFLRLTLAYADVERNQENYTDVVNLKEVNVGYQILYSYKVNPLTKFFLGYSESAYDQDDLRELTTNGRSVFMKMSYAWLR